MAGGFFATPATSAETDAAILKKLAMMDKLRAQQAADAAARAAEEPEQDDDEDWARMARTRRPCLRPCRRGGCCRGLPGVEGWPQGGSVRVANSESPPP
jgi:hypothetical protein